MADVMLSEDEVRYPVNLSTVLENELDEVRSAYTTAVVTVEGTVPPVEVLASDMLGSVFRNLLKNAIQHNDEDVPRVRVAATMADDTVRVRIADNGPGVPDDRKDKVFGKGNRGLESQGTGIGL